MAIFLILFLLLLSACDNIQPIDDMTTRLYINNVRPISIGRAVIDGGNMPTGSTLGVFIVDSESSTVNVDEKFNVYYTRLSSNSWNPGWDVFLDDASYKLYSYTPYSHTDDMHAVPIKSGTVDCMWGTPLSGITAANNTVDIQMNHLLSVLRFNIGNSAGNETVTSLRVESIAISDGGTLDVTTGVVTPNHHSLVTSTETVYIVGTDTYFDIMVIPTGRTDVINVFLQVDGVSYHGVTAAGVALQPGYIYNHTLTLADASRSANDRDMFINTGKVEIW